MSKIFLRLPKERYSPIDFYLDKVKAKEIPKANILKLTKSAFDRMRIDTYFFTQGKIQDTWIGREITIDGDYPILQYVVMPRENMYYILSIKSGSDISIFGFNEISDFVVVEINY